MIALDDSTRHMITHDTHTRIAQYNNNVNTLDKKIFLYVRKIYKNTCIHTKSIVII